MQITRLVISDGDIQHASDVWVWKYPLVSPHCFKFPLVHLCVWGNFLCF